MRPGTLHYLHQGSPISGSSQETCGWLACVHEIELDVLDVGYGLEIALPVRADVELAQAVLRAGLEIDEPELVEAVG